MNFPKFKNHKKLLAIAVAAIGLPALAHAITNGVLSTTAVLVLGQPDFIHSTANTPNGLSLNTPVNIAIDPSGGASATRVYIADYNNNRVLGWDSVSTLTSGAAANIVLGQTNLTSSVCNQGVGTEPNTLCNPISVAVDSSGNVWVADYGNNRVLEYAKPAANAMGPNANLVLGQAGDFTANRCNFGGGPNAETLCNPRGVSVDSANNVYVTDWDNNRVLEFNTPLTVNGGVPGSGDTIADEVFGQPDFLSSACNQGASPSATTICLPYGHVAFDTSGNVYVADQQNSRVLEYNKPALNSIDPAANTVIGQPDFVTTSCNDNSATNGALNLCFPESVALDGANNLYVADTLNQRVLEYNTPLTTDLIADNVYGQGGDFSSRSCDVDGTTATSETLCTPSDAVVVPASGQLWIADQTNNRALAVNAPLTNETANLELGQIDFTHTVANNVSTTSSNAPEGVAVDISVTPNRLYVADYRNNRVLGYSSESALATGAPASIVLGQPDFESASANYNGVTPNSLSGPVGLAVDSQGNLYVADDGNARVLEYNKPFASGFTAAQPANTVWGQDGDFYSNSCNLGTTPGADTLCSPNGVALDSAGNLYVADYNDNRVLEYDNPLNNIAANFVFGQSGSFTSDTCNLGGVETAATLCGPVGVAVDNQGNVYVSDTRNQRALEYNNPFAPGGSATANLVFGQGGNFTTGGCNFNGVTASSLCNPNLIAVDPTGNLFVTDFSNSRTLEFTTPAVSGNTTATHVFGQGDNFTSNACDLSATHPSAQTECEPVAVAADATGNIFVADYGNNRTLKYDPPSVGPRGALFDHIAAGKSVTKTFYFQSSSLLVNISSIGFTGASAANFSETNTCPAELKPRSKCAINVTYKSTGGNPSATLSVTDDAYNSPSTAQLR